MVEKFIEEFTKAAHERGIRNLEFYAESVQSASVNIYEKQPEFQTESDVEACYVEGEYQGYKGYIYAEDFSEEYLEEKLDQFCEIAEYLKEPYEAKELGNCTCQKEFELSGVEHMTEQLLQTVEACEGIHPDFNKFSHLSARETIRRIVIQNDRGGRMEDAVKFAGVYVGAEAVKNDAVQTSGGEDVKGSAGELKMEAVAREAVEEACSLLGASPVETKKYPVILKNSVICEMLSMYLPSFGADTVRKNISKLAGQAGKEVASEIVNLVEDPEGLNARSFDDEGTPTVKKYLIRDGILGEYLYNQAEALLAGKKSTGNGFKSSYRSVPAIGVTNLKLIGEEKSREMLIEELQDGLYITACDGMFAGADPVSGDFSLISKGYLVKNGKLDRAVNQIAVAGNFYDMLKNIRGIANDYLVTGGAEGIFEAPSVSVGELVVSGK